MSDMALEFSEVAFGYRRNTRVFDNFSLQINKSAVVLLGPNGAGKSTLMAIAASHHDLSQGVVSWSGLRPIGRRNRARYRSLVAWLPQQVVPVPGLTVREQVAYVGWLKGMSRRAAWDASKEALSRVNMTDLYSRKSHQLSGGQLRRMGIAGALVHNSEILLLDEPTAGLDLNQRKVFRALVEDLANDVHLVVSTHQTEDLASIYQEVVVIDAGQVRFQGPVVSFEDLADEIVPASHRAESAYSQLVKQEM